MDFNNILFLVISVLGGLLFITMCALFFVSRRAQKTMQSLLTIMTQPDRAKIQDASRVLQTIMADEVAKISGCLQSVHNTLRGHIVAAEALKKELIEHNEALVNTANNAVQRVAQMSDRMDNTVTGLRNVVESDSWSDVSNATDRFAETVAKTLNDITTTTTDSTEKISKIQDDIEHWNSASKSMSAELQQSIDANTDAFQKLTEQSDKMQEQITELGKTSTEGFINIKNSADKYEDVLKNNDKIINGYLAKLETFGKQSKKQLTTQMNTLVNTANVVGAQVLLAETSVEKQNRKLTDIVETMMTSATETESSVRGISTELAGLTNHFESEIKEFATGVVSQLETVSGVANTTLKDTKSAANAFSESVKTMATGVRETLIEMNTAHTQLSGQSEGLIKMSVETTEKLRPLSELIEKYYSALPDLAKTSGDAGDNLTETVAKLDDKISSISKTVNESVATISESAMKLDNLAGQSRQQMIDLMSDYAKAVDTMQTLNKQMMVARAAAPMDAIKTAPVDIPARASSRDFLSTSGRDFDKMYEQSIDLTRAMGGDIPDIVWKKYHAGDKSVFAKWLGKKIKATDKKQIRDLLKSDFVFKSQATQFVRSFDKILAAARQTDQADKLVAALIKTDLGIVYSALSVQINA